MIKFGRIMMAVILLASLAACGRRQAVRDSILATQRAAGQQPAAPPVQQQPQPQPQPGSGTGGPAIKIIAHNTNTAAPRVGEPVTFFMDIQNSGDGVAENIEWIIFPNYEENNPSQHLLAGAIARLAPGESIRVEGVYTYWEAGDYPVRMEPNTTQVGGTPNNWLSITVTVQP